MHQSVILVGPATGLYALSTPEMPPFAIPVLGTSLIGRNVLWLAECCDEIFIVGLNHYHEILKRLVLKIQHKFPLKENKRKLRKDLDIITSHNGTTVYFIPIITYDGSITSIFLVKKYIEGNFIVTKGNVVSNIPLSEFLKMKIFTLLVEQADAPLIGYTDGKIYVYNSDYILCMENQYHNLILTSNYDTAQVYFFTSQIFNKLDETLFSIRNSIPALLQHTSLPFSIPDKNNFITIKTIDDYIAACHIVKRQIRKSEKILSTNEGSQENLRKVDNLFIYENNRDIIPFNEDTNIVGKNFVNEGYVANVVAGGNCRVGRDSMVVNTILMDNVQIGGNCEIRDSVISTGVVVPNNSKIIRCRISPGYIFHDEVNIEDLSVSRPCSRRE